MQTLKVRRWMLAGSLLAAVPSGAGAALRAVVTTPEIASVARAIGGNRVTVTTLTKPTEDPHFVDAKPSLVVALNRADLLIEGGADLEVGWLSPLVEGARNAKVLPGAVGRLSAAEGVALLDVPATLDRSRGDIHASGNPHFMMDPVNAGIVAQHVAERFCRVDAAGCAAYHANLDRFQRTLKAKMGEWTRTLAPFRGKALVTYHNTWRYFGNRFELRMDTFLEPKPGIPPSPPHLAQVIAKMKAQGIRAILVEPYQSRKTAEVVAGHTGAKVVSVCQFPGGLPGTSDYFSLMDANVRAIASALAG